MQEVVQGINQSCGGDFIIGLKMPGDEGVAGGIDPGEAARITTALAESSALDYFAYSQGNFTLSLETMRRTCISGAVFLDIHKRCGLRAPAARHGDRRACNACRG